jgi:hypothetical protein
MDIKKALKARGWIENVDEHSNMFDFKFMMKKTQIHERPVRLKPS